MKNGDTPDWVKWGVIGKPRPLYIPPFMMSAEGFPKSGPGASEAYNEKAGEILKEHWDGAVDILQKDGYAALVTMKDRLQENREEAKNSFERWRDRTRYVQLVRTAYANPGEWADADVPEDVHGRPMGEILLSRNGGARGDLIVGEGWEIVWEGWTNDPTELTFDDWSVEYRPTDDVLKRRNINPEHVDPLESRRFSAADTWRDAVDALQDPLTRNADWQRLFDRTEQLIAFRSNVVEAVLYRFEVFGSVEKLDPAGAEHMAGEELTKEGVRERTTSRQREDAATMLRFARKKDPNTYSDLHIPLELNCTDGRKGESITRGAQRFVENAFGVYPGDVSECVAYLEEADEKGCLPVSDTSE